MIARIWHGRVNKDKADEYADFVRTVEHLPQNLPSRLHLIFKGLIIPTLL